MPEQDTRPRTTVSVSVVIASYNRKPFLATCLEHLGRQTYTDFEIIIVDDGSRDGSDELVEPFRRACPQLPISWMRNETNRGANFSRNRGVRAAQGKWIAFIDSDCYPEPSWLGQMVEAFDADNVAAVTGRTYNVKARTVYELAYQGSSIIHASGSGEAPRLTSSNLLVRRDLLLRYPLEEDLKYGCNEEGLYLRLRSARYRQRVVSEAVVWHDHPYQRRSFFRRAHILGSAAAWLVYKYRLRHRIDLIPFIVAYATLPLGLVHPALLAVPALCFALAMAALLYNELFRKLKTLRQTLISFPLVVAYYQVRLWAYVKESIKLRLGGNAIERVSLPG